MVSFTRRGGTGSRWRPGGRLALPRRAGQAPLLPAAYDELGDRAETPLRDIVLLCRDAPVRIANDLARRYPDSTVHLLDFYGIDAEPLAELDGVALHVGVSGDERMAALAGLPAPQLIIDIAPDLDRQLARLSRLFYFLEPGGSYVLHHRPRVTAGARPAPAATRPAPLVALEVAAGENHRNLFRAELLESCSGVDFAPGVAAPDSITFVRKRHEHLVALRDSAADERLAARFGSTWGETIAERPAHRFEVTATVTTHGDRGAWYGQVEGDAVLDTIDVPRLALRRYHDVVCWPEQLVAKDNVWLPDTFRHQSHGRLQHRRLTGPNHWHARRNDPNDLTPRSVDGPLFYFDTEYPGHFGHVLTEVVSRWWGWCEAKRQVPELRPVTTRPFRTPGIPGFQRDIFRALGIDPDDIEYIRWGDALTVRELYTASPMLSMPNYVSPELAEAWSTVGAALRTDGPGRPRRIFIARRVKPIRSCTNTAEVEAFFRDLGFELYYPEDHSFPEQVSAFAAADVIAGFAGSNMFTAMFAGAKQLIVITADTYNANNEFLIAAVTGSDLHYVVGHAHHQHPDEEWDWLAYQSNFTVDLGRLGPEIRAVLRG